jgi:hypothetical protein
VSMSRDPRTIKVMSCARFVSLLETLAVRVNAVRGIQPSKGKSSSRSKAARRRAAAGSAYAR